MEEENNRIEQWCKKAQKYPVKDLNSISGPDEFIVIVFHFRELVVKSIPERWLLKNNSTN